MRRDVLRVGLARLAFELALGVTLLLASPDRERAISIALALLGVTIVFATRERWATARRAFIAAHLALGACAVLAIAGDWAPAIRIPGLALALGAAIELTHLDLVARRKVHEELKTLRWPRSIVLRRMGSVIIASVGARAMVSVEASAQLASRLGVVLLLVALGACVALTAGFAVGPGRPHARPIDAILFLGMGAALALHPMP